MRSLLLPFLFAATLIFTVNPSFAQRKTKIYTAKVSSVDKKVYRGIFKSADDKGLYLVNKAGEKFIAADKLNTIKIRSKRAVNTGVTVGLLTGLAVGAAGVAVLHSDDELANTAVIVGGVWTTFFGAIIGGKIGGHPKEKLVINGNHKTYLDKLNVLKKYTSDDATGK